MGSPAIRGEQPSSCRRVGRFAASRGCKAFSLIAAAFCMTSFFLMFFYVLPMFREKLRENLVLRNETSEPWSHPVAPTYMYLRFFNITNPEAYMKDGEKPVVTEMGPYVYRIVPQKVDLSWNQNLTVSYRELFTFHFEPDMTAGSEDDVITSVNIPMIAVQEQMGAFSGLATSYLKENAWHKIEKHTVKELLWGYENMVLKDIKSATDSYILKSLGLVPDIDANPGYFKEVNGTAGPVYNVFTGEGNFSKFNLIHSWDFKTKLDCWSTHVANSIRGNDGSIFQPFLDEQSRLTFFYSQLLRNFNLQFQENVGYKGLNLLRFVIPDSDFSNTSIADNFDIDVADVDSESDSLQSSDSDSGTEDESAGHDDQNVEDEDEKDYTQHDDDDDYYYDDYEDETNEDDDLNEGETDVDASSSNETKSEEEEDGGFFSHFLSKRSTKEVEGNGYCIPFCVPSGAYSIASCNQGAPIYISLPHFLGADPFYHSLVGGMRPIEDKHRPTFDIDRVTGATVITKRRHQLNVRMSGGPSDVTFMPVFWAETIAVVDEESLSQLQLATKVEIVLKGVALFFLCAVGFFLVLTIFSIVLGYINPEKRYRPLLPPPTAQKQEECLCC